MSGRAALLGLSQVSAAGTGTAALREALGRAAPEPEWVPCSPSEPSLRVPVLRFRPAGDAGPADPAVLRRMDPFSRHALLAGSLALAETGSGVAPERLGLVVATGQGPLATTFGFLDQLQDKGDNRGSPALFSGSLHNAPAAWLSIVLGLRGPSLTLGGFRQPFARALGAAVAWLDEGRAERVLLVAVDEFSPVVGYGLHGLGLSAKDGRMRPLAFAEPSVVPGETCVAFALGRAEKQPPKWGFVRAPLPLDAATAPLPDAAGDAPVFLAARGDPAEGAGYAAIPADAPLAAPSPWWGANPTSEAMTVAAAALALADGALPAGPQAADAPPGRRVAAPGPFAARAVHACTMDARGCGARISLERE